MRKKIVCVFFVLFSIISIVSAQEWKVTVGESSPIFSVVGKEGNVITTEDLKGKVVLINFFATWCPPCREELPRLQSEIWDKWKNRKDFAVLVLAREQGWDKLDPFMRDHQYTFPVFPDLNRRVFSLFAEQSIPRNVILDKTGKIIYQSIGYEKAEFSKMIELIQEQLKN